MIGCFRLPGLVLWRGGRACVEREHVNLGQVVLTVQHFTRRWPDVKRFPGDAACAEGDADGGFERLLRALRNSVFLVMSRSRASFTSILGDDRSAPGVTVDGTA